MARVPQVTRTIQTTKVVALCAKIKEGKVDTITLSLPRTFKDDKALLKAAQNAVTDENIKVVAIQSATVEETLYGMSEQKFIELADILPPRKVYEKAE